MASPAQILRSCLVDLGIVMIPGGPLDIEQVVNPPVTQVLPPNQQAPVQAIRVPCVVSGMPDEPDSCVSIEDVAGKSFGRDFRTGKANRQPGLKVTIRTLDYTGYDLANRIARAFDQELFPHLTVVPEDGTTHYVANVNRTSDIISLGEEIGTRRQRWVITARIVFEAQEPSLG